MPRLSRRTFALGVAGTLLPALVGRRTGAARAAAEGGGTTIIANGKPAATLVTADAISDVAQYAAQELAWHIEKATGSRPAIVAEAALSRRSPRGSLIFLGRTKFAAKAGIAWAKLDPESCVIRTVDTHLCIVGFDAPGHPLDVDTSAGTLFGVYEILERHLDVRWLWPGELGAVVPRIQSLVIEATDQTVIPRFEQRHVRLGAGMKSEAAAAMGFTAAAAHDYMVAQKVFLRRHRMGRRQRAKYGHAFVKWWDRFGAQHPEWFQLVNGRRGPVKTGGRFSMCISNPDLRNEIVAQWRQQGGGKPGGQTRFINAVENDVPGQCECDQCRALDGPEPADYRRFISPKSQIASKPFVTDRYVKSWLAIQEIAARDDPEATVVGYAYFNYFVPPTSGVTLNDRVMIGFCPSSWFYPRAEDEHDWMKAQWLGWAKTGAKMFMRTNYFLDGYCMPYIFAHQFADDFQNAARNKLSGTDFDLLTGQWATQGPNLYLLMRLHIRPDMKADDVLAEYYAGFGPAAEAVKVYFDYWEAFLASIQAHLANIFESFGASRWRSFARAAQATFAPDSFSTGEALLATAANAAAGDDDASRRVQFLQLGLEHAKLCCEAAARLTLGDLQSTYEGGKDALDTLIAFRRAHERSFISNFNHCAWVEEQSWVLPAPAPKAEDVP